MGADVWSSFISPSVRERKKHLPALPGGQRCAVGASVGVAMWPDDGSEAGELMARADDAMYAAKRAGKHRIEFSSTTSARNA